MLLLLYIPEMTTDRAFFESSLQLFAAEDSFLIGDQQAS